MMKDPLREEDLSFAREEENTPKNRDPNVIPRKSFNKVMDESLTMEMCIEGLLQSLISILGILYRYFQ